MDRRYLAGLIDGEGCIQSKGKKHAGVKLTIANSYKPLIEMLYNEFGGGIREYIDKRPYKSGRFRKPVYHWAIYDIKAEDILRKCYPYLIVKKEQAKIMFSIRKNINTNYYRVPSNELKRRVSLKNELDKLNKKGVSPFELAQKNKGVKYNG